MKKVLFILFLCTVNQGIAQIDTNSLFSLPIATTVDINGVNTALLQDGTMVFDTKRKRIYEYDGTGWRALLISPVVETKTGNYTLTPADDGNVLRFNSASNVTLTVPGGLPIGYNVSIYQIGTGKVIITGAGGVTVSNRLSRFRTAGVNAGAGLVCTSNNIFHLTGDLKRN